MSIQDLMKWYDLSVNFDIEEEHKERVRSEIEKHYGDKRLSSQTRWKLKKLYQKCSRAS